MQLCILSDLNVTSISSLLSSSLDRWCIKPTYIRQPDKDRLKHWLRLTPAYCLNFPYTLRGLQAASQPYSKPLWVSLNSPVIRNKYKLRMCVCLCVYKSCFEPSSFALQVSCLLVHRKLKAEVRKKKSPPEGCIPSTEQPVRLQNQFSVLSRWDLNLKAPTEPHTLKTTGSLATHHWNTNCRLGSAY